MQVTKTELQSTFTPFELKLKIDTLQEQIALFCVFNHGAVATFLSGNHVPVLDIANKLFPDSSDYSGQHSKLCKKMREYC